jgi:peptide/nickel transport system ATP-binding protein
VAVLYAGRVAEIGPVHEVINHPKHPYTAGLMAAIPDIEKDREFLHQIDGAMPRLNAIPTGCAFNPRCDKAVAKCYTDRPNLVHTGTTQAACWLHQEI